MPLFDLFGVLNVKVDALHSNVARPGDGGRQGDEPRGPPHAVLQRDVPIVKPRPPTLYERPGKVGTEPAPHHEAIVLGHKRVGVPAPLQRRLVEAVDGEDLLAQPRRVTHALEGPLEVVQAIRRYHDVGLEDDGGDGLSVVEGEAKQKEDIGGRGRVRLQKERQDAKVGRAVPQVDAGCPIYGLDDARYFLGGPILTED